MLRSSRLGTVLSVLVAVLALTGCFERRTGAIQPRLGFVQDIRLNVGGYKNVDLVLVVDDSGSMGQEQDILESRISGLVRDLTSPPDQNGDGRPDWGAVERLRVAVVTTDVGTSGAPSDAVDNCAGRGDDGEYQSGRDSCGATPGLQVYGPGDDANAFSARIGCIVDSLGTDGCAIEQQLEAGARAVERGADVSGGFPAEDAILAVLVLTDEEDCSLEQPAEFYEAFERSSRPNLICQDAVSDANGASSAWLRSTDALATRLSAGRTSENFVFAAIAGMPIELSGQTPATILAHPDMQYGERIVVNERGQQQLVPDFACESENGDAAPARRLVQIASRFEGSVLHSICADDYGPAIAEVTRAIAERTGSLCLTRRIPVIGEGVECDVRFTLPAGQSCDSAKGQTEIARTESGAAVCRITQVPGGTGGQGYFYEDSAECPSLTFTEQARPPLGTSVSASCYFEVPPDGSIAADAGSPTGP